MKIEAGELYAQAQSFLVEERWGDAVGVLRSLVEQQPASRGARLELARALFHFGQPAEAVAVLEGFEADPDHPLVRTNLGAACAAAGQPDKEAAAYAAIEGIPGLPWEYQYNRGLLALEKGDAKGAAAAAGALRAAGGPAGLVGLLEGLAAELRGDPAAAAEALTAACQDPDAGWEVHYNAGRCWLEAERPDDAVAPLEAALEAGGRRWEILLALGNAHLVAGRVEAATPALAEAARLSPPGEVTASVNLGAALLEGGDAAQAAVLLRAAAQSACEDRDLDLLLARATFASGDYEAAADLYSRVVEADPGHFRARYNLAFSLERIGRDDEAREAYRAALTRRPGHYKSMNKLSRLDCRHGDYDAALSLAEKSIGHEDEANAEGYYAKALALRGLGRVAEALEAVEEATKRDPKLQAAWKDKAFLLRRLGRPEEAKEAAKASLALAGEGDPESLLELGMAYLELEDEAGAAKARTAFKRALARRKDWPRALSGLAQASARVDEPKVARRYAKKAIEAGGGYRAYAALAEVHARAGEHQKAIEAFKQCLTRNKGYLPGYLGIAAAYDGLELPEKAAKYREMHAGIAAG